MSCWIAKVYRVVAYIRIPIPTLRVGYVWHDGIKLDEAVKIRVIRAERVIWLCSRNTLTAVRVSANMYGRRIEMQNTKLTVRVPRDLLENIKRYAQQNNTTMTALIEAYLRRIPAQEPFEDAPIVRRLSGSLSQNVTIQDHKEHLAEKYG